MQSMYQYMSVFVRYQNLRQMKQQVANIQTADVKTLEMDTQTGDDMPIVTLPVEKKKADWQFAKASTLEGKDIVGSQQRQSTKFSMAKVW